jgi:hypothetical protein
MEVLSLINFNTLDLNTQQKYCKFLNLNETTKNFVENYIQFLKLPFNPYNFLKYVDEWDYVPDKMLFFRNGGKTGNPYDYFKLTNSGLCMKYAPDAVDNYHFKKPYILNDLINDCERVGIELHFKQVS